LSGGLQSPQAAETGGATGLAISNQNALTPLLYKQENLVDNITTRCIRWMYDWNMQFNERMDIKCDVEIDVRTPILQIAAQAEKLDLERLSMEAGQNPLVEAKVDMDKLTDLRLSAMHIPYESITRTPEEVQQYLQQKAQNEKPDPNQIKAEAAMMDAQSKQKQIALDEKRLEFDIEEGARRADLAMMEARMKDETRQEESLSRLLVAQTQERIAMIENATKQGIDAAHLQVEEQKAFLDSQVKLFIAGQNAQLKSNDQVIKMDEHKLKREQGSGV
jgi:hypothetical protein